MNLALVPKTTDHGLCEGCTESTSYPGQGLGDPVRGPELPLLVTV